MTHPLPQDLITVDEICTIFRFPLDKTGRERVQRLLRSGKLDGYKCGGEWRSTAKFVAEYLERGRAVRGRPLKAPVSGFTGRRVRAQGQAG